MELHHSKHHQTYVNGLNTATEQLEAAKAKNDVAAQIALQPLINFHGGGHLNHSLFWENLAPKSSGGGGQPEGALKVSRFCLTCSTLHTKYWKSGLSLLQITVLWIDLLNWISRVP